MTFVAVNTEEQQACAMLFRTRGLLVPQRKQLIDALRDHLSEHPEHALDFRAAETATRSRLRQLTDGVDIVGAIQGDRIRDLIRADIMTNADRASTIGSACPRTTRKERASVAGRGLCKFGAEEGAVGGHRLLRDEEQTGHSTFLRK